VNVVAATLAATHAGLAVVDPGGRLRLATAVGWPNGLTVDADPKRGHAALTLAARAPIVVEDIDDEQRFSADGLRARGLASGMSVVVLGEDDEPFGVLSMHSTERRAFTNDDIAFLTSVAHVLTGAIRHDAAARDLRHQSLHDPLTHLPNRALMLDRLRHGLARARRDGSMLAVLFCDMDDFKYVNDSLGHEAGDLLLADLAPRLQGALRSTDTLARFGGDEFVVLCEGLHDTCEALALADRLLAACATPVDLGGTEFVPGASIGIALAPPGCDADPEGLLRDADVALYQAKSGGKGRHEVFDARMRVRTLERVSLIADLRRAISGGELELAFQPIVGLELGEVVGVEALVRWRHPARGLLLPSEFIGLAEDSGLIHDLGRWVLDEAVRHGARWRASGTPVLERARVGVNISWRQIARGTLVEDVRAALDRHGLDASALWFEVTETALMEDPGRSRITLRQLRELGAELALDDFGTGQSSLSVLRGFALDVLKLDRSFVSGRGEWEIVRAVCEMARSLDMRVVAEGIELPAQAEQARAMGAVYGQGWLYSPPLGLDGFEDAMLALSGALRRGQVGPTT
jgi:diguanylate cyclase (GGDEF)-like protein